MMNDLHNQIFNLSQAPSIVFDVNEPNFTILEVNEAFLSLVMATKKHLVGLMLHDAFPGLNKDQSGEEFLNGLRQPLLTQEPFKIPVLRLDLYNHIKNQQEERYWELVSYPLLDQEGQTIRILVMVNDITTRIQDLMGNKPGNQDGEDFDFKFKNIFDKSSVGVALMDLESKWLEINPKMVDFFGYSRWDLLKKDFRSLLHPADLDDFEDTIQRMLSGEIDSHKTEKRAYNRNGKVVWLYMSLSLVRDKEGLPCHFVTHLLDITEKKSIELALRDSEQRYQSLFHHNPDPVFAFDLEGRFVSANEATCQVLEIKLEKLLNTIFLPLIPFEEKRMVFENFLLATEGKSISFVTKIISTKGTIKTLNVTFLPITSNEEIVGVYGIAKDVTDKMLAEHAVLKAKNQYEQLISTIDGMVWEADENLQTRYVSPQTAKILGYSQEEWYQKSNFWLDHIHPEDQKRILREFLDGMVKGENLIFEMRMMAADGRVVWLRNNVAVIKSPGRTTILRGVMTDITKAKQAERALAANEAKLSKILKGSLDLICTIDEEGRFMDVNPASEKVLGYLPTEMIGRPILDFVHEEDKRPAEKAKKETLSGVDLTDFTARFIHKNKTQVHLSWSVHFDPSENLGYCVAKDITDRISADMALRETNQRFEMVTQATSDAIWDWNLVDNRVFRGIGYLKLFGYDPKDLPQVALNWEDKIHPKDYELVQQSMQGFLNGTDNTWEQEYRFMKSNGEYAYVSDKAYLVRDAAGKAIRLVGATQDISKEKFLEKEDKLRIVLSDIFRKESSPHKALNQTLDVLLDFTELDYGEVWFLSYEKKKLTLTAYSGECHETPDNFITSLSIGEGLSGKVLQNPEKTYFSNIQEIDNYRRKDFAIANQLESSVVFPIKNNGRTIAIFCLYSRDKNLPIEKTPPVNNNICEQIGSDFVWKKAENDLNLFFDLSSDLLFITNIQGDFKKVNKAATSLLGYTEEEICNTPFLNLVHPEDQKITAEVYSQLKDGKALLGFENRLLNKAGQTIWVSWSCTPVLEEENVFSVGRDITTKKHQDEELKASKEQVTKTLESIKDAFFALDSNWNVTYWNQEAERYLGVKRENVLGRNLWDSFPEAISLAFYDKYNQVMTEKVTVTFEEYFPPVETWFDVTAYPAENGITVYFKDITKRKKIEQELLQFKKVIESSKEGIGIINFQQNTNYRNPALIASIGELSQSESGVTIPTIDYADPYQAKKVFETLMAGNYFSGEVSLKKRNGEEADFHLSAGPIYDENNQLMAIYGIHTVLQKKTTTPKNEKVKSHG